MTKNLDKKGFRSISNDYELFFIDIWGVLHNGVSLHQDAVRVLDNLKKQDKNYVLLTNAPRPNKTVIKFLIKMGLSPEHCEKVYTSGEAALNYLSKNLNKSKFFHIGPIRDFDLFKLFEKNKVNHINDSEFILCTGLFEEHES